MVAVGQKCEGIIPEDLEKLAQSLIAQINEYLDGKKTGKDASNSNEKEGKNEKSGGLSFESSDEKKFVWTDNVDYEEVKSTFCTIFPFDNKQGVDFCQKIAQVNQD